MLLGELKEEARAVKFCPNCRNFKLIQFTIVNSENQKEICLDCYKYIFEPFLTKEKEFEMSEFTERIWDILSDSEKARIRVRRFRK